MLDGKASFSLMGQGSHIIRLQLTWTWRMVTSLKSGPKRPQILMFGTFSKPYSVCSVTCKMIWFLWFIRMEKNVCRGGQTSFFF